MRRGMYGLAAAMAFIVIGFMACDGGGMTTTEDSTGTVRGSVSTQSGAVSGVTVELTDVGTTTTDGTGSYSFSDVEAGTYKVVMTLPDSLELAEGETLEKTVTVVGGTTTTASWSLNDPNAPVTVTLAGTSFTPANLTIEVGTTVRWVWQSGTHTVTPDDPNQLGVWTGTDLRSSGATFEYTFTEAGQSYDYHCNPHESQGMVGNVTVTN